MTFIDTSAIYALADRADRNHAAATQQLQRLLDGEETLITHNYVIVESVALIQARLGLSTAVKFAKESAAFTIQWIDNELHASGIQELQKSAKRRLSLVDHISFLVMRRYKIEVAFAFDPDFAGAGFRLLPG